MAWRWLLPLALVVSGCSDAPAQDAPEVQPSEEPAPPADVTGTAPATLRWGPDGALFEGDPNGDAPHEIELQPFVPWYFAGTWEGVEALGAPLPNAVHVTAATLTVHVRHDAPGYNVLDPIGFPEMGFLFGTPSIHMSFIFLQGDPMAAAGATQALTAEIPLPEGGLVLPAGSQVHILGGSVWAHPEAVGNTMLLVNHADADTRIDLVATPIGLPTPANSTTLAATGHVTGNACLGTAVTPSFDMPFDVTGSTVEVHVVLEPMTASPKAGDLDLHVLAPSGTTIGKSTGPFTDEAVSLYLPNIEAGGPGTWTARVISCDHHDVDVGVAVTLNEAAPDDA